MVDEPQRPQPGRENRTRLILALAIGVVLVIFAVQNRREVRVDFLFFHWDSRVIFVIIVSALLGGLAAWLVGRHRRRARREERRR